VAAARREKLGEAAEQDAVPGLGFNAAEQVVQRRLRVAEGALNPWLSATHQRLRRRAGACRNGLCLTILRWGLS
jgi:hypothetical protein